MTFVGTWLVTAIAVAVAAWLVPGIVVIGGNIAGPVLSALALALVNKLVKPLVKVLSLPLNILTLGIFNLVINASMLELASYLSREVFHSGIAVESFGAAFWGAIIVAIVSTVVGSATGLD